jgi:purine-binding chemotaxis protein CheW
MVSGEMAENRTYLTFTLDKEDFAVDVAGVREVLDFTEITRVPRTPDFMKGVINLRGSVVPVVDLRLKFGLPETEKTVDTCIIVLEVDMEGEITVIGAVADSVREVFEINTADIEPPPRIGTRFETEFISGMGKHNDAFIIILDVNKVFSTRELELIRYSDKDEPEIDAGSGSVKGAGAGSGERSRAAAGRKVESAEDAVNRPPDEPDGGAVAEKQAARKTTGKKS